MPRFPGCAEAATLGFVVYPLRGKEKDLIQQRKPAARILDGLSPVCPGNELVFPVECGMEMTIYSTN
jgi:hypothetical protein